MLRRLEDRIKELCSKAIATPESPELNQVLKDLQAALREHSQRLRRMAFDRHSVRPDRRSLTFEVTDRCAICGKPIMLEQSKVSADGKPLHERCFVTEIEGG
jgi:hypothetical protein